jgi:hypothetical protein
LAKNTLRRLPLMVISTENKFSVSVGVIATFVCKTPPEGKVRLDMRMASEMDGEFSMAHNTNAYSKNSDP